MFCLEDSEDCVPSAQLSYAIESRVSVVGVNCPLRYMHDTLCMPYPNKKEAPGFSVYKFEDTC